MSRYAIYFMPHELGELARFGTSVLGYDAASGTNVPYPDHPLFEDPAALGWTAAPRRYGFHATLKAPFRLAAGHVEEGLAVGLEAFAANRSAFAINLKLAEMRDFFALVPVEPTAELHRLADDCVRDFDDFRAPLAPADRERRHPDRLTPRERDHLDAWGYPYIFDDFRFHMTLTSSLTLQDRIVLEPVLSDLFALVPPMTAIDAVTLVRQDDEAGGRFVAVRRCPFALG